MELKRLKVKLTIEKDDSIIHKEIHREEWKTLFHLQRFGIKKGLKKITGRLRLTELSYLLFHYVHCLLQRVVSLIPTLFFGLRRYTNTVRGLLFYTSLKLFKSPQNLLRYTKDSLYIWRWQKSPIENL